MQKWSALVLAVVTVAAVVLVFKERPHAAGPTPAPTTSASAAAPDAGPADAGAPDDGGADAGDDDAGSGDPALAASDAGTTLLDGSPVPGLAAKAPKSVVFGVILVQYKGAQGAPPNARSHEAALELAKQLAEEAKKDFKATVSKGDKGSQENAGRMPRGMIEPAPEYVLFSLPKDGVSDPVDTPRGFWIVHRIE
jgi:hypothetical protein